MNKIKILKTIISIILVGVFVFSGYKIVSYYIEEKQASNVYDNLKNIAIKPNFESNSEITNENTDENKTEVKSNTLDFTVDFKALKEKNKDIVAWIYCPDTPINYPIVRGKDNEEYLRHLPNGKYNYAGSIFADYRNDEKREDSNYIIYGHNMKNDSMFGTLTEYYNQKYYDKHPIIYLLTPYKNYEIQLYSGYIAPANSYAYTINRKTDEADKYMNRISRESTFITNAEYTSGDKTVTLSTCTNVNDKERYVIVGILKEII